MSKVFCRFGFHRWGTASARVLDPRTVVYVYICERCGKKVEGGERKSHDKNKQTSFLADEL